MSMIWQKGEVDVDRAIMAFMAGEDVVLDRILFPYDIQASIAHVQGLGRIGLLTTEEAARLEEQLQAIGKAFEQGELQLDARFEDMHSAIEFWLTERLGDLGKKVHAGRSRNDQVLVAMRLYLRDSLQQLQDHCTEVAEICLRRAEETRTQPMPGYTHLQRAVVSSVGMWFAGFAEAFIDNARLAQQTWQWLNANPLGTAAGYGVNLPLDRAHTTETLGFERMQVNPIYTQNSRGKFELQALMAWLQPLLDLRRLAWDISLFTTTEFDLVRLPDRYTTGSSIMPNKRNPDFVELMRASAARLQGAQVELLSLLSLPSGYQRDLQFGKGPVLHALQHAQQLMQLVPDFLQHVVFDAENCKKAISVEMYATDRAVELAAEQVPFREAYRQVVREYDQLKDRTPEQSLAARVSPGACAALELDQLQARLRVLQTA